jgi:predicted CopG family antitoxin
MGKNISISDDVYRRLKRQKGDRSFSEVIEAKLDEGGRLMDVTGNRVLDPEAVDTATEEID